MIPLVTYVNGLGLVAGVMGAVEAQSADHIINQRADRHSSNTTITQNHSSKTLEPVLTSAQSSSKGHYFNMPRTAMTCWNLSSMRRPKW